MEKYDVFISYRRQNSGEDKADRLKEKLEKVGYTVFFDYESLNDGNYIEDIHNAVDSCTDFIMLMSEGYLDRCVEPNDPVAMEISTAVHANKHIIPLNYNNEFDYSKWPLGLPDEINSIKEINALEFYAGQYYENSFEKLIEWLDSELTPEAIEIREFREYLKTKEGRLSIKEFELLQHTETDLDEAVNIYYNYAPQYELNSDENDEQNFKQALESWWNFTEGINPPADLDAAVDLYYNLLHYICAQSDEQTWDEIPQSNFKGSLGQILFMSKALYRMAPEYYIPYLFDCRIQELYNKCILFNFGIPAEPKRSDYRYKCEYYMILCHSLYNFRKKYSLTLAELCVLLYNYKTLPADFSECEDLPKPTSAWFIGGQSVDLEKVAKYRIWQGNPETCQGDILVHYETTPVSAITSIWRAEDAGYIDPYFYYHSYTFVGHCIHIPKEMWITKDELVRDDYFKDHKLVRKNMQGVNGWTVSYQDYQHLLFLLSQKGFDINTLPSLQDPEQKLVFTVEKGHFVGGVGYVLKGVVEHGTVKKSDDVVLLGEDFYKEVSVAGIVDETYQTVEDSAKVGDHVGIVIKDLSRSELRQIVSIES